MRFLGALLTTLAAPLTAPVAMVPQLLLGVGPFWNSQSAAQPNQEVVGEWTLCRQTIIRARKGVLRSSADTTDVVSNVCTKVVFKADGKGFAGLDGGTKYEFLWQQQEQVVIITYLLPAVNPTRLHGGTYQLTVTAIPARRSNSPFVQLGLSTAKGTLFLLRTNQ